MRRRRARPQATGWLERLSIGKEFLLQGEWPVRTARTVPIRLEGFQPTSLAEPQPEEPQPRQHVRDLEELRPG